ncbi:MAG: DUF4389 domain-containing protein [archaeon]|jgi:hypothetical protein
MAVTVSVKPDVKVSRLEVIIRIPMCIILGIILYIMSIIVGILWVINIITSLILAKRVAAGFTAKVIEWMTKIMAYLYLVTDERPPFLPSF